MKKYGILTCYVLLVIGFYYASGAFFRLLVLIDAGSHFYQQTLSLVYIALESSFFLVLLVSLFSKKVRSILMDKGEYLINVFPYIYRFFLAPFHSESASDVAARHTQRKLDRIERKKYTRSRKK